MINLIRSEWIKFRSVRSTLFTLLLAGGLVVLVAFFATRDADQSSATSRGYECVQTEQVAQPNDFCPDGMEPVSTVNETVTNLSALTGGVSVAVLLFGVIGVQVIGQEYRFNTIRTTFTANPNRLKVMFAKLAVCVGACAAISVVMVGFCWVVGQVMIDNFAVDGTDRRLAAGIVIFSAGWTAIGFGIGAILRQPIASILVLAAEALIVEGILANLFDSSAKWLPFLNGIQMTLRNEQSEGGLRTVLGGGIYFYVVAVVIVGIGLSLADRRDA